MAKKTLQDLQKQIEKLEGRQETEWNSNRASMIRYLKVNMMRTAGVTDSTTVRWTGAPKKEKAPKVKAAAAPKPASGLKDAIAEFYDSWDWKTLRYVVLKERGRKCECCNLSADDGAVMNVDHVKPIRLHWDLRLVKSNLQVLCKDCNMGKGSWDQTDWRQGTEFPMQQDGRST